MVAFKSTFCLGTLDKKQVFVLCVASKMHFITANAFKKTKLAQALLGMYKLSLAFRRVIFVVFYEVNR